jgi:hypothetical protein
MKKQIPMSDDSQNLLIRNNSMDSQKKYSDNENNNGEVPSRLKITGFTNTSTAINTERNALGNSDNKLNKLTKNLQTIEIKKESKLISNDLNGSNIEITGRDPSTASTDETNSPSTPSIAESIVSTSIERDPIDFENLRIVKVL